MLGDVGGGRVACLGSNRIAPTLRHQNQLHLHNRLDRELQKFLRPLNLSRYILLSSRYSVRDNFITPNSRRHRCCSFLVTFCFVIIYTIALLFREDMKHFQNLLKIIYIINHIIYIILSALNAVFNACRSDAHVSLIVNIQRLHSSFKFVKISYSGFVFRNWVYVLSIIIFFIVLSGIHIYLGNFSFTLFMCYVVLLLADLDILYTIRIIKFLTHSITSSVLELERDGEVIINNEEGNNEERIRTEHWDRMVSAYLNTVDCLHAYRNVYEATSFCYMCIIFLNSLTNVQMLIVNSSKNVLTSIIATLWVLKQTVLLFLLSFESEGLFVTLKNAQVTFTMKLTEVERSNRRKAYKALCRVSREASSALRAGGVLSVDAALPLTLASVVATYAVVLLQIAFL